MVLKVDQDKNIGTTESHQTHSNYAVNRCGFVQTGGGRWRQFGKKKLKDDALWPKLLKNKGLHIKIEDAHWSLRSVSSIFMIKKFHPLPSTQRK